MADASDELPSVVSFSTDIAKAEAPPPLPKKTYKATIQEAHVRLSQKGSKYAEIHFFISPDQFPADYDASASPDGKKLIFRRLGLEDNPIARYNLRKFCEAVGAPATKQIDVMDWVGRDADIEVDHSVYEGVTREEVKKVVKA
jgi:hypothetical protein